MSQIQPQTIETPMNQKELQMRSVEYYRQLSAEEQQEMLKKAKGGSWYDGWKPYCGKCSTMSRMESKDYGFACRFCRNMIGFDLYRVLESPLNKKNA